MPFLVLCFIARVVSAGVPLWGVGHGEGLGAMDGREGRKDAAGLWLLGAVRGRRSM